MSVVKIGFCITPHGYGHAARASAVMQALSRKVDAEFVLATTVGAHFFSPAVRAPLHIHPLQVDIGLVQKTSLVEDLEVTLDALAQFLPFDERLLAEAAGCFSGCRMIVCDIAPLGIAVAKRLKIPSLLVENFTWDWIYAAYAEKYPELKPYMNFFGQLFSQADYHIQAEPVCVPDATARTVGPVARRPGGSATALRQRFIHGRNRLVLVTMGGGNPQQIAPDAMLDSPDTTYVVTGAQGATAQQANIWWLAGDTTVYHPDLVAAADIVVGKVGYSTLAEVYQARSLFGYVARPAFPESAPLINFIRKHLSSKEISLTALQSGQWVQELDGFVPPEQPEKRETLGDGAEQLAAFIMEKCE